MSKNSAKIKNTATKNAPAILLTGGGSAGHVTPNLALLPALQKEGFIVSYIGSHGIEKELVARCGIPYFTISSGKLRRYLSLKNVTDVFRVVKGLGDAVKIVKNEKPAIIFSKGGFVSVPVVIAGKLCGVPVVVHESDITPGLSNKIAYPLASAVCASFPETMALLPKNKGVLTGTPIRRELFDGSKMRGLDFCGFDGKKPVLLVMGGSLGSVKINECVRAILPALLKNFDVAHLCGKGKLRPDIKYSGYKQFEYVSDQMPDLLECASLVVSRAGANSINEFLALKKPNLLIPLPKLASRGDQILNAASFEKQGYSRVLAEENLTADSLITEINGIYANRADFVRAMSASPLNNGISEIIAVLLNVLKKNNNAKQ